MQQTEEDFEIMIAGEKVSLSVTHVGFSEDDDDDGIAESEAFFKDRPKTDLPLTLITDPIQARIESGECQGVIDVPKEGYYQFPPLSMGESVYVISGKIVWRVM